MTDELEQMGPIELRTRLAMTRELYDKASDNIARLARDLDEARATIARHSLLFAKWERLKVRALLVDIRRNLVTGDIAPQAFIDRIDALLAEEPNHG